MSFILDALRKSEHERQRQSGPSIAELPVARADRSPNWAPIAVMLLVALNVGILLFFLLRDQAPAPVAVTAPAPASLMISPPTPAATANPAASAAAAPQAATPAAVAPAVVEPLESVAGPADLPPPAPDPTLLPAVPAGAPVAVLRSTAEAMVPSIHELPPQATAGLPVYSVDLHIYSDDPARRAVFINGRRYQEGGALPEGPTVETITRDGAIISYRGRRFLLPRQ